MNRALAILFTLATLVEFFLLWRDAFSGGPWEEDMVFMMMYACGAYAGWYGKLVRRWP